MNAETETGSKRFGTATETETADSAKESRRIPIHGSFSRPASPDEGLKEMRSGRVRWQRGDLNVTISTDEFTAVCPTTGMPDFYSVSIEYTPDKYYLESKTVKYYFYAFRDYGAHGERLAQIILNHVRRAIDPKAVRVVVNQSPRGGLRIVSEATWTKGQQYVVTMQPAGEALLADNSAVETAEIIAPEVIH